MDELSTPPEKESPFSCSVSPVSQTRQPPPVPSTTTPTTIVADTTTCTSAVSSLTNTPNSLADSSLSNGVPFSCTLPLEDEDPHFNINSSNSHGDSGNSNLSFPNFSVLLSASSSSNNINSSSRDPLETHSYASLPSSLIMNATTEAVESVPLSPKHDESAAKILFTSDQDDTQNLLNASTMPQNEEEEGEKEEEPLMLDNNDVSDNDFSSPNLWNTQTSPIPLPNNKHNETPLATTGVSSPFAWKDGVLSQKSSPPRKSPNQTAPTMECTDTSVLSLGLPPNELLFAITNTPRNNKRFRRRRRRSPPPEVGPDTCSCTTLSSLETTGSCSSSHLVVHNMHHKKGCKLKASWVRWGLRLWTLLGFLTTTSLVVYQSVYLDSWLVAQQQQERDSRLDLKPLRLPPAWNNGPRDQQSRVRPWNRPRLPLQQQLPPQDEETLVDIIPVTLPRPMPSLKRHVLEEKTMVHDPTIWSLRYSTQRRQRRHVISSWYHEATRRIVSLKEPLTPVDKVPHRSLILYPATFTDHTQLYGVLDSNDVRMHKMEPREPLVQGDCVPMKEWQTTFHPSCNEVHSMGLERLGDDLAPNHFNLFGRKGYWRNAWRVDSPLHNDTVVLKTLKVEHNFEEAHFEHDRIDAVAMERLTFSQHVIDIFGFCGHSVVTEYADGKSLGSLADKAKKTSLERLRIARDIAHGLADVHGIDALDDGGDNNNVTFVHLDINPANVISVGGTLKLNDFNIGIIRKWNTTSNEPCGFPAQYPNPQWRSPEEARNETNLTEKVDVFSMGHIFFRLICGHEPWNKLEPHGKPSKAAVTKAVQLGTLPTIPPEISNSTDEEVVAIRQAMLSCYTFDPKQRPSARQIAAELQASLERLEQQQQQVQKE